MFLCLKRNNFLLRFKVVSPDVICLLRSYLWIWINVMSGILQVKGGRGGFQKPFSNFCPSHPKPKKFQSTQPSGKNESVVCQTNFRAKNQKCVQSDWASKRAKRFSFQSRDWKDQKVWTKSSWWSEIPRDRLNIPNRSAVRWEKDQTVLSRASQLWIYIYVYIYSIYACSYSYRGDSLTKFLDL